MNNNDVLRRLRYALDLEDSKMVELFGLGGQTVTDAQVNAWLKRDEDPDFQVCAEALFAAFLNGLIVDRRGPRQDARPPAVDPINNNTILMKLRIALDLQGDRLLALIELGGHKLSKHELSAFFRKPSNKHYRQCRDQVLRKFLRGLQLELRGTAPSD
ncbi:MAG: DUF1456 family protein [Myxococcales bacterium]|nr:DUF1456 family protein [Myxococcales bacterium]